MPPGLAVDPWRNGDHQGIPVIMRSTAFVDFSGGRSGSAVSTWGQYSIWTEMLEDAPDHERFNVPIYNSYEKGIPISDLIAAIHRALATHESLRTRLRGRPDGGLEQVLYGDVRLPIDIVDTNDGDTELANKKVLWERLLSKPFDFESEWPIRVGAIARNGSIRYVLVVVSHHAIDGWAVRFLERTLWRQGITASASLSLQPLDEAQYQMSPAGQRIAAAAEDYWRNTLLQAPPTMFQGKSTEQRAPRHCIGTLISSALPVAAQCLSRDLKVGPSAILLAALSTAISRITKTDRCVLRVQANNRSKRELRQAVSSVTMEGLFLVETGDIPFREIVRRAWIAAQATYRYAYYDKRRIDAVRAEVERERRCRIDLSCWVNDMQSAGAYPPLCELKVPNIVAKLGLTEVQWPRRLERHHNVTVGLRAYGSPEAVKLELIADTHVLMPGQIERILRGIEAIVVEEVAGPGLISLDYSPV